MNSTSTTPIKDVPAKAAATDNPDAAAPISATIVICVESGPLETQSIWLLESLRRWGGRIAKCPVIAVSPRFGLPLDGSTLKRFRELDVQWVSFRGDSCWSFYGPFNKPLALAAAEEMTDSDIMVWLDSDVIVAGEPDKFELDGGVDFRAYPCSCLFDIGSTGITDDHDSFWRASLEGHGISPEDYPFISARPDESEKMRMYWQAGAFAYRRDTKLGATFLQVTHDQMKIGVSSRHSGTYFHEQVGLAIAVHRQGLKFEVLDQSHNYRIKDVMFDQVDESTLAEAKLMHYFGSAWPETFDGFVETIRRSRPDIADWLCERGPLSEKRAFFKRVVGRVLRHRRKNQAARYAESCRVY